MEASWPSTTHKARLVFAALSVALAVVGCTSIPTEKVAAKPQVNGASESAGTDSTGSGASARRSTTTTTPKRATTTTARATSTTSTLPSSGPPPTVPAASATPPSSASSNTTAPDLARRLNALPVGWLDGSHPYNRVDDFGPAWADVDRNGCDTRNDILHRDLTQIQTRPGTHECVVIAGYLADPYTGTTITFLKAQASEVQIDHLIPLHAAWQLGAWKWSFEQRKAYANDPRVLLAVSGSQNQSKSDKLADEWKPPNRGYWCEYAARTITIHEIYSLPVTAAEKVALGGMAATCAGAPAAMTTAPPAPAPATTPAPPTPPTAAPTVPPTAPPTQPPADVYYANCTAARAAGVTPIYRGQPGYRAGLDRDNDGIACE